MPAGADWHLSSHSPPTGRSSLPLLVDRPAVRAWSLARSGSHLIPSLPSDLICQRPRILCLNFDGYDPVRSPELTGKMLNPGSLDPNFKELDPDELAQPRCMSGGGP